MRIAMILTRDIETSLSRCNILRAIRSAFNETGDVSVLRLYTIFEKRAWRDILLLPFRFVWGYLKGEPESFQVLLFDSRVEKRKLLDELQNGDFDLVYFDTLRGLALLRAVRQTKMKSRVITDLDDLMSRRARVMIGMGRSIGLGQFSQRLPRWVGKLLAMRWFGLFITRHEAAALALAEREAVLLSDAVVLVSSHEAEQLRSHLYQHLRQRVHSIFPIVDNDYLFPTTVISTPVRFVFVGPDSQVQNEQAIEWLLRKWKSISPSADLHIYGRQRLNWPDTPGVTWHGFVEDLSVAYDSSSLVLAPFFFSGGVKTKILEGWMYGRPVLSMPEGFEGMKLEDYPLNFDKEEWSELLIAPMAYLELWKSAQIIGQKFICLRKSDFLHDWVQLVYEIKDDT